MYGSDAVDLYMLLQQFKSVCFLDTRPVLDYL